MDSVRFTDVRSALNQASDDAETFREWTDRAAILVDALEDAMTELQVAKDVVWRLATQLEEHVNARA